MENMISKERFTEIWNATLGPLFEDGTVEWSCSPTLEAALLAGLKPDEASDDEVAEMVELGIL